jgi:hypothetical protein
MYGKLVSLVLAAAAIATVAAPAGAAPVAKKKPLTGTWSGKTSQDIVITDPQTGEDSYNDWSVRITVTALNGHLAGIYTSVRYVCPDPAAGDIRIFKGWRPGTGPLLTKHGGFSVRVSGVSISGVLGAGNGSGRFDVARGGCSGKGSWKVKRVL